MKLTTVANRENLTHTADCFRIDASGKIEEELRSELGQFLTPAPIAGFMASLFGPLQSPLRILDPGAGVGSLCAALVDRWMREASCPSATCTAIELDSAFEEYLSSTLQTAAMAASQKGLDLETHIKAEDFILASETNSLFDNDNESYTHVITNPPYKKISAHSPHRRALRKCGLETSNLYTGFLFLAAEKLVSNGEMVAIVPRSFCNGPYFKDFRKKFFDRMSLRHIHIFDSRNLAFKSDSVLQENIIFHAVKTNEHTHICITSSRGADFRRDEESGTIYADDMTERVVPYDAVFAQDDKNRFVFIASNNMEQNVVDRMGRFSATIEDLGIEVSTGPVVDFRLKTDLRKSHETGTVPLLYPGHFRDGELQWPKETKKPNAIYVSDESRKWLWLNSGHFVVTKRFSTKEERRRIVASTYDGALPGELIGFENHLNVFHSKQQGLAEEFARGLELYLNSSLVDRYFRLFNGHTQVNATDLRSLVYPERDVLIRWGTAARKERLTQKEIDNLIEEEIGGMSEDVDPIKAQATIDEALEILKALGLPRGQQNKRSALTLLALVNLSPDGDWSDLDRPLMGITPIMDYCREIFGEAYAPNTRETFRRQTMHQFVEAGIAVYNPDKPERPVNSPKACYQISDEALVMMKSFGTDSWEGTLAAYLEGQPTLAAKWAKHRKMQMIPVQVEDGVSIDLTPGVHSELIEAIITQFAPRYAPGSEVIYVGDTGDKVGYFREERLRELGVTVDKHGKMPDVVLYFTTKNWLLLIESVTSHGPVDGKRHTELSTLFADAKPGLVYVTAFPDRSVMGRFLSDISWETEVWCADAPTHLIHFNGERFLGPYEE